MSGQDWFWTDEWQANEAAVDDDIAAGRVYRFASVTEALSWLRDDSDEVSA